MGKRQETFRLRLNLFDSIVLLAALAVGAFLLWRAVKPDSAPVQQAESAAVRYTVCLQRCIPGTGDAVAEGARLTDSIRNYELGNVVSAEARPAQELLTDSVNKRWALTEIPGFEDVYITVESPGTITEAGVTLSSGYALRVGASAYIQGDGFLGSGIIYAIERGDG